MNILIVSDAWHPQINGVARTLEALENELCNLGHMVTIAGPDLNGKHLYPLPFYPEIKLEFFAHKRLGSLIDDLRPDVIHIATEGPLGWAARRVCLRRSLPFTTAFHTKFPEYLASRVPVFAAKAVMRLTYAALRRFHAPSKAVMAATASLERELKQRGFKNVVRWTRGVDTRLFKPYGKVCVTYAHLPKPILLYVGRVSVEKNIRDFLALKTTGSHIVIGDGPDLPLLQKEFPKAHFLGVLEGEALARHYAAADLFVFPSKTDTFGLVLLEACACGLRVAAYPATGPLDLFMTKEARQFAALNTDLQQAVDRALRLPDAPDEPRKFAEGYSWEACAGQFCARL